jgi:hypothetical protein
VVAIMAIIMGILIMSLGQTQGRGLQMAAAQVASGLGLARQIAITRNTDSLFLIAPRSGSNPGDFMPSEPFRYWSVVYSNRGQNTWTLASDWKELPTGTVFAGLVGQGYNNLTWPTDGSLPTPGTPFTPRIANSRLGEWQYFNNFTNIDIIWSTNGSTTISQTPCVGFRPDGRAFANTNSSAVAVVLGEGAISSENQIILRSINNIIHVETDTRGGRVVVRPRESYR